MSPLRVAASKKTLPSRVLFERTEKKIQETFQRLVQICSLPNHQAFVFLRWEEEFFCIQRDHYLRRPDLLVCGQALFGNQSLEKREIPPPLDIEKSAFLLEIEEEIGSLSSLMQIIKRGGAIYAVSDGPRQGEKALESHRQFIELTQKAAQRHGFTCLFSERSFPGYHLLKKEFFWSLKTEEGRDWLDPNFSELGFLIVSAAISHAFNEHKLLLENYVSLEKANFHEHAIRFRSIHSELDLYFSFSIINAVICDSLALILDEIADAASQLQKKDLRALLSIVKPICHRHYLHENVKTDSPVFTTHFSTLLEKKSERIFQGLLTPADLQSICDEKAEKYARKAIDSAQVIVELSREAILPAIDAHLHRLRQTHSPSEVQINSLQSHLIKAIDGLTHSLEMVNDLGWEAKCQACDQLLFSQIQEAGHLISTLENEIDASLWPFPRYEDMIS